VRCDYSYSSIFKYVLQCRAQKPYHILYLLETFYIYYFSTDLPNEDIAATIIRLAERKTHLRNEYCNMENNDQFRSNLDSSQHRMLYLLCRGPKFDTQGTRFTKSSTYRNLKLCNNFLDGHFQAIS
jgi:hypothetical protein